LKVAKTLLDYWKSLEKLALLVNKKVDTFLFVSGKFIVRYKKVRQGRNYQIGEKLDISARRVLKFSLSNVFKRGMNV
jgi:nucleoid DNA-binding protein